MSHSAWRKITDGTEQRERLPLPLQEGFIRPDERSFAQLLALGAEIAESVSFYDLANLKDGNWRELFLCDEAAVLALILACDIRALETRFLLFARTGQLWFQGLLIFEVARSIDTWYRRLEVADSARAAELSWHILTAVEKELAPALHSLGRFLEALPPLEEKPGFASLHKMWGIKKEGSAAVFTPAPEERGRSAREAAEFLHDTFRSFLNAMSYLKECSRKIFPHSLPTGSHDPAIGLFMAFLRLFERAQEQINSFPGRHRDFYYRHLLGFAPREEVGDSAYLLVHPDGGGREIFIPKGTEFCAGKDGEGEEILYCSDADSALSDAVVRSLRTLYLERDPLVSPERELGFVTGAYSGSIPAGCDSAGSGNSYPLFGERGSRTGEGGSGEALLGFAVATPVLFLAEGRREVVVALGFLPLPEEDPPFQGGQGTFFSRFGRLFSSYLLSGKGEEILGEEEKKRLLESASGAVSDHSFRVIKNLLRGSRQDIFFSFFRKLFLVALSVEGGWHEVQHPAVTPAPAGTSGLRFAFELGPEAPAVVAATPSVHGVGDGTLPLLRVAVNPKADFYPYSLFAGVRLSDLSIDVRVTGVTDLLLYNNHGQLDPSKPFNPFGPLPTRDSYLVVGNYEMARKKLHSLALNLEWGELPRCKGGFQEHYRAYGDSYGNAAFQAQAAVLRDGEWRPVPGSHGLFETESDGFSVAARKRLQLKGLLLFGRVPPAVGRDDFRYDQRARNGFVRLGLSAPESAFGHGDYGRLLTRTLVANSAVKRRRRDLPLPNPPYTPMVSAISADYTARAAIKTSSDSAEGGEKIYHLHPFGTEVVHPSRLKSVPLLPETPYEGNLFIGLSPASPGPLNLFFHLKKDTERVAQGGTTAIAWFYLAGNQWRRLRQGQISSDSTEGFLSSGIVTLEIPDDIRCDSSVMPAGYYWLRLSARGDLSSFCSLYSVRAGAIRVTRRLKGSGGTASSGRVPPGTIRQAMISIPGMERVSQPLESFGGRGRESARELTVRSSERLRHKQRAVLAWDYERLILEQFPEVLKAKCFPNLKISTGVNPAPGHLLIVVLPRMKEGESETSLCPHLNAAELGRIRAWVSSLASPFANIEVRNPAYELIRIVCSVRLKPEAQGRKGIYLNKLNQAVIDYPSPWRSVGYQARFGWCIRRGEVESFLMEQGYVEMVTGFSLLHIVAGEDDLCSLSDTARTGRNVLRQGNRDVAATDEVCPRYPWSLAMPTADHTISLLDRAEPWPAEPTGLNRLQIGQTFIVGG